MAGCGGCQAAARARAEAKAAAAGFVVTVEGEDPVKHYSEVEARAAVKRAERSGKTASWAVAG